MLRIVLADDHAMFREGLRMILELQPEFEIVGEASDGEEAVKFVQELQPDLVILDIEMPNINGILAASEMFSASPETKVLALSRHNEKQYVSEMFAAGASGYILKDSAGEELIEAINAVMSGQLYCTPSLMGVVLSEFSEQQKTGEKSGFAMLTPKEIEVLKHIADGKNIKEIASDLHVSYKTIASHRSQIIKKLKIHSDVDLAKYAIRKGLSEL